SIEERRACQVKWDVSLILLLILLIFPFLVGRNEGAELLNSNGLGNKFVPEHLVYSVEITEKGKLSHSGGESISQLEASKFFVIDKLFSFLMFSSNNTVQQSSNQDREEDETYFFYYVYFVTFLCCIWFLIILPFIFLAKKQIGKNFAFKTFLAVLGLSLSLLIINYPVITSDKLLVSIFGGFFLGAGIGLSVRGGSVLDGTEVLSIYLSRKVNMSIGEIIFLINLVIFSFAAIFLGIEPALYSILIYLSASKTVDFIIVGIEEYIGITVISDKSEEIRKKLTKSLGKGVTIYKGRKGFSEPTESKDIDVIFTVVTRLEVLKIKHEIISIDPSAVIIEHSINEARGGLLKKRPVY
ncbi:MAG: YitT family protein, partial [Nanoarchaeota archaeon]